MLILLYCIISLIFLFKQLIVFLKKSSGYFFSFKIVLMNFNIFCSVIWWFEEKFFIVFLRFEWKLKYRKRQWKRSSRIILWKSPKNQSWRTVVGFVCHPNLWQLVDFQLSKCSLANITSPLAENFIVAYFGAEKCCIFNISTVNVFCGSFSKTKGMVRYFEKC